MIVICTHDGGQHLISCLDSLSTFGTFGHEVLVVDTESKDAAHLRLLGTLRSRYSNLDLRVEVSEFGGYELGAIRHAYFKYHPDKLLLVHDSIRFLANWWGYFEDQFKVGADVVPWITFYPVEYDHDTPDTPEDFTQEAFVQDKYEADPLELPFGIFGSIFCATAECLDRVEAIGGLSFTCDFKCMSQAMERAWTAAFQKVGAAISPVLAMHIQSIVIYINAGVTASGTPIPCLSKVAIRRA